MLLSKKHYVLLPDIIFPQNQFWGGGGNNLRFMTDKVPDMFKARGEVSPAKPQGGPSTPEESIIRLEALPFSKRLIYS